MNMLDYDPKELFGFVPDHEQLAAIQAPFGVNVVLAGPGAGKSTVIVCRILYLAKVRKVNTRDITVLVFNRDAKESLSRRLKVVCDRLNLLPPEVCTIHSKCYQIVRTNNFRQIAIEEKGLDWYRQKLGKDFITEDIRKGDYERLAATISKIRENNLNSGEIIDPTFGSLDRVLELLEDGEGDEKLSFDEMSSKALRFLKQGKGSKVPHLLVDEAQDITETQFRIIETLGQQDIFMVGDGDQCIYGFRHASSRYIDSPEEYFPKFTRFYIGTNYRSTEQVVDISSVFINKLSPGRKRPMLRAVEGKVGPTPEIRVVSRQKDQFRMVRDAWEDCNINDQSLCVIYRNNSTAVALANFLISNGLWANHIGGGGDFFSLPVIRDILVKVKRFAYGTGEVMLSLEELIRHIAVSTGIIPEVSKVAVYERMQKTNFIHDYMLLLEIASSCRSIKEFLERIEKIKGLLSNKGQGKMTIATAHSVKGLEFHTVFVIDMVQGVFPAIQGEEKDLEGEARLMYVAMTRATNRLVMTCPEIIRGRPCEKSEFLTLLLEILNKSKGGH